MNLGQAVAVCLWELRRREIQGTTSRLESSVQGKKQNVMIDSGLGRAQPGQGKAGCGDPYRRKDY